MQQVLSQISVDPQVISRASADEDLGLPAVGLSRFGSKLDEIWLTTHNSPDRICSRHRIRLPH